MNIATCIASASAVLLLAGAGSQDAPPATARHGAFAFPDATGTRLLSPADPSDPGTLRTALCSNGSGVAIRFAGRQNGRDGGTARQTPENFDRIAGDVFSIVQGRVGGDGIICFLARDVLVSSSSPMSIAAPRRSPACAPAVRQQIADSRHRGVVSCWTIAGLPDARSFVLAEFALEGTHALASVVLVDGGHTTFADYPATFKGSGQDLWRVDDGGVLSPDGFRIVFALRGAMGYVFGVSWGAAEGESLQVFESGDGDVFRQVINEYWYQAPA